MFKAALNKGIVAQVDLLGSIAAALVAMI